MPTREGARPSEEPAFTTALARWENEGGKSAAITVIDGGGFVEGLPPLPPGHMTQVAWGFRDPVDGMLYELHRVYLPARDLHGLGPTHRLDEDLSYWLTSYRVEAGDHAHPRLLCRWIDYAGARRLVGPGLTFLQFSSPLPRADQTPRSLQLRTADIEPPPADLPLPGHLAISRS
jgi:hypothetical protein